MSAPETTRPSTGEVVKGRSGSTPAVRSCSHERLESVRVFGRLPVTGVRGCTEAGVRKASIPAIRDRVVQGALKLILEPVFEADFQPGSFGYRPKRAAHDAIKRVAEAIVQRKTRVLDFDLRAYFDNVRHDRLLEKVAQRVDDADILHLLKVMLKASGKKGVPQGGVISPLLSNLYLNEVDRMLERAREVTRNGKYTYIDMRDSQTIW